VTAAQVHGWIAEEVEQLPVDTDALIADTGRRIAEWNTLGRSLCSRFLEVAERSAVPA
jgi:hypothetical protein